MTDTSPLIRANIKGLRFGKLPAKADYRTLLFSNYLRDDLPLPPPMMSQRVRVCANLGLPTETLFPMDANDEMGNCTIAAAAHGLTIYHGMVKETHIPTTQSVVKIYKGLTGGDDSGLYLLDVVKYWRSTGIEDSKIFAYTKVSKYNHTHVKQAINIFGGVMLGFQCQEKVQEEFNQGMPWQPGRLIDSGHAVYAVGYDSSGVEVLTWGTMQRGTWAWWDACVDECYALLPPESMKPEFTPGFDFDRLRKDLSEVAFLW